MSASVIRAAIMGGLVILSLYTGRKSNGLLSLLFSADLMLMFHPKMLFHDMSFQLSFLATLGLLLFVPIIERKALFLQKLPVVIREPLTVTLAAQILTTPLIAYRFGRLSLIAPLTNVLFLPLVPFLMFFAFIAMICRIVFSPLEALLTGVAILLSALLLGGVHISALVPYASVEFPPISAWVMGVMFVFNTVAYFIFRKPKWAQCP
jgi:competence protein ComEC